MLDIISEKEAQNILKTKKYDNNMVKNEDTSNSSFVVVDKLPSNFKGYPEGTRISYKPITLGELEALNSGSVEVERGIAMLLKAIHCNTLKPQDLYYWDVMYIGIQRKLLAFGDTRGIIYEQCPNCGNIVEKEFDYTELEFKEIEAPNLPVIAKIQNKEVEFGLITIKDFLEINTEKGELDVYARMIKNIPYEQAYNLLYTCEGKDSKCVKFIDKKLNYGLKPLFQPCEKCNTEVRMEVRSPFEVVFPEDKFDEYSEFEIRYGKE